MRVRLFMYLVVVGVLKLCILKLLVRFYCLEIVCCIVVNILLWVVMCVCVYIMYVSCPEVTLCG